MPRMYQDSWNQLKKSKLSPKRIQIAAPKLFHPRIYKAIIKEKDMDLMFKLELSETGQHARLSRKSDGNILTIFMCIKFPNVSIGLDDF